MQALKLITAPVNPAVSLTEIKSYLRVDGSTDDDMLTAFISAATTIIEKWISRSLITQTWALWMDEFPSYRSREIPEGVTEGRLADYFSDSKFICLPLFPLQSVTHLKTYADDNVAVTMDPSLYHVDTVSEPGRLSLTNASTWPTTFLRPIHGIEIQFVCGYGLTSSSIPTAITQAIKEMVGKFYSARGCEDAEVTSVVAALLRPYKIMRIG